MRARELDRVALLRFLSFSELECSTFFSIRSVAEHAFPFRLSAGIQRHYTIVSLASSNFVLPHMF